MGWDGMGWGKSWGAKYVALLPFGLGYAMQGDEEDGLTGYLLPPRPSFLFPTPPPPDPVNAFFLPSTFPFGHSPPTPPTPPRRRRKALPN